MFRHPTPEENMKAYGQAEPPEYELHNIEGFKLRLITGTKDLMASPDDYNWLKEQLCIRNEDTEMWEYELGHSSLVTPVDKTHIIRILDGIKELNIEQLPELDGDQTRIEVMKTREDGKSENGFQEMEDGQITQNNFESEKI